jgi:hypothetical protein
MKSAFESKEVKNIFYSRCKNYHAGIRIPQTVVPKRQASLIRSKPLYQWDPRLIHYFIPSGKILSAFERKFFALMTFSVLAERIRKADFVFVQLKTTLRS